MTNRGYRTPTKPITDDQAKNKRMFLNKNIFTVNDKFLYSDDVKSNWIIDSGASCSISPKYEMFSNYKKVKNIKIKTAGGEALQVLGQGDILINFFSNEQPFKFLLKDVYHVPKANFALISVSQLANQGYSIEFKSDSGEVMLTGNGTCAMIGKLNEQDLYSIHESKPRNMNNLKTANATATTRDTIFHCGLNYLHKMLAHMNVASIKEMIINGQLGGIRVTDMTWNGCDACNRAKGGRTPITKESRAKITEPGFIVGDVMDMLDRCLGNYKYVSTFIDVATRFCSVEIFKTKDRHNILNHFRKFRNILTTPI